VYGLAVATLEIMAEGMQVSGKVHGANGSVQAEKPTA
jgi:hypothetical protein